MMASKNHNVFYVMLSSATKPKLKLHLQQKHSEHADKELSFFQRQKMSWKRQKLDATGYL